MLVELRDRLDAARRNPRIRAVVLRIDSPGGTVTAADLIHREIVKFKRETHVPVIATMVDTAASGGIYIAMAADEIYALPTTITGSIGVIAMYPDLSQLLGKVGVGMNVIKAGKLKDEGSPWRPMTDEERQVMQHIVDQYNQRFRDVILESRKDKGLTPEMLAKVADGRVLTPQQAVEAKLIDGIKYQDEAIARAKEVAHLYDAEVVSYEYPYHYRGNIFARDEAPKPQAGGQGPIAFNLFSFQSDALVRELFGARFLYLWMP
jgi:protease-4